MFADTFAWRCAMGLAALLLFGHGSRVLAADPSTRLTGSVLDAKGKPFAGVAVGILLTKNVEALRKVQPKLALATRTDASGRFQLSLPQSLREAAVLAVSTGLTSEPLWAKLDAQQRELPPLRLLPGLTIQGRVTDEAGRPLAAVKVSGKLGPQWVSTVGPLYGFATQTRQDGSFVSSGLRRESYQLRAELAGYGIWTDTHAFITQDADTRTRQIKLRPAAYLSGVVTDPGGQPLPGVKLTEGGEDPRIVALTDRNGRFRLGPVPADTETWFTMSLSGYASETQQFKAPQDDMALVLARTGALRGRVVDAATGSAVKEFHIEFEWRQDAQTGQMERPQPRAMTTNDGRFELPDVPPGTWALTAAARGYVPRELRGVDVSPGVATPELLIELQRGITLRGRVIEKASGKPVAKVGIDYGDPLRNRALTSRGTDVRAAITDAQGVFVLSGLPAGTLTINAQSYDYLTWSRRMVLTQDASIEIRLSDGAAISGQVLAPDGVTPVEAWVTTMSEHGNSGSNTPEDGRFDLRHRPAGRYRISATGMNGPARSMDAPEREVTVTEDQHIEGIKLILQPAPFIRGTIAGLSPAELRQLCVDEVSAEKKPDGKWYWRGNLFTTSRDATIEGASYRIRQRQSGPMIVIAGPSQGPQVHKRIVVPERGDVTLDFDLAGGMQVTGRVTRAGKPAPGISMFALPDEGQPVAGFTQTGANGEYRFADLASGRYRVGPVNVKFTQLQMTGNVVHDFELPALEIEGRAADATTGQPLSAVRVELRAMQPDAMTERRSAVTDGEGSFKLDLLAPGNYLLTLQRVGYDVIRQELTLRSSLDALSFAMRAAEGVRLRVRGPDLGTVSSATLVERAGTVVIAVVPVSLDVTGVGNLPPSLAGHTFTIDVYGYEPFLVSAWDGGPLDVGLRKRAAR